MGGVVFEWMDEWWKAYEPFMHDTKGLFTGPFPDGFMHEEWLGVCAQGDGKTEPVFKAITQSRILPIRNCGSRSGSLDRERRQYIV